MNVLLARVFLMLKSNSIIIFYQMQLGEQWDISHLCLLQMRFFYSNKQGDKYNTESNNK